MANGIWIVLVIPAIIAFVFATWVFYSMLVDASERNIGLDNLNSCVSGCQQTPLDMR